MNKRRDHDLGSEPASPFVTEADWIPAFWGYLLGLDRDDLIAELIQNDLDQHATRTIITFEQNHLICEGNGMPVEPEGWQRLRKIQGAGDSVPAKSGKIGVKNHGLKTAFTIGDEIRLMSDGQTITQTLFARGRGKPPYPGASAQPVPGPEAPIEGCRIIIRYRAEPIEPEQGEAIVLGSVSPQEIDALFRSICASVPEQFAGIVSPKKVPCYEIVLRHYRLGEVRFQFSSKRPRNIGKGIELFRRSCLVSGTVNPLPNGINEEAARRLMPLKGRLRKRVANFFRHDNRFFVEVSWPIDGNGKPRRGTGRLRYPIGYPQDSHEARTGHSTYFNAPIASDNKRHGPAREEETNKALRVACETLLIDVLVCHTIPRWGPIGLNLLVPSSQADNEDEAVRPLLAVLASRNAMPTLKWREAVELFAKNRRVKVPGGLRRFVGHGADRLVKKYKFIVSAMTWKDSQIHPALSIISPSLELQVDPRIPPEIIRLLADGDTDGFLDQFITFDQNDAISQAAGKYNKYFDTPPEPEQEWAQPFIGLAYLDVINEALMNGKCDENSLLESLLLPDLHGKPTSLEALHTCASLPSDVPGLHLPPILHADLAAHPLFRRKRWRLPKYTMGSFLESYALHVAEEQTRQCFWNWLRKNERHIAPGDRAKLADIPIWPDKNGNLCKLTDLCEPRNYRVSAVLTGFIRQPHDQVRRLKLVSFGTRSRTSIRRLPTEDEVRMWLDKRMAANVVNEAPDDSAIADLHRFEAELVTLLKNAGIAHLLKAVVVTLPALAKDGSIRQRSTLVRESRATLLIALPGRFLLKNKRTKLDMLSPPLSEPTAEMLLDTFVENAANFDALQPRLQQFLNITQAGDNTRRQLADMPIIPVGGQPRPPSQLAFTGSKGDYWGGWKIRVGVKELSQDDQKRYRAIGVTPAQPDRGTSQAFFEWLSDQSEDTLKHHIPCVLRHILHCNGPEHWAKTFTDKPCIPVKSRSGVRLVSLHAVKRSPVYLPDAEKIAEAIISGDPAVLLVIDCVREVMEPITEPLCRLGVISLREALKEPERVSGSGDIAPAGQNMFAKFDALRAPQFRRTFLKRLAELGVERGLVWYDWNDRLSRVKDIRFADQVEASYRFRRRSYPVDANGGFDPKSGVFWMKRDHPIVLSCFYEAIAAMLIFKPAARPVDLLALERALVLEVSDPSFGHPADTGAGLNADEALTDYACLNEYEEQVDEAANSDLGEAVFGHAPFEPDASRNIPKPGPLSSHARRSSCAERSKGTDKDKTDIVITPELEKEHIQDLKRNHYASHCQICLCKRLPQELAPAGSYIEWEEVRRRIVEAHHVDLKSAGGARHAGNLILLCKLHHDNYGRLLTRSAITDALKGRITEKIITFGADDDAVSRVRVRQIELVISATGAAVEILFTEEHAEYWLSEVQVREKLRNPD